MCSASQPSSRAMTEAMRRAKHFLPSRALPPYPDPYDQISRVSGKCTMYLLSALQGQGTSACPLASGAPTEWTQGTNSPSLAQHLERALPMRVMIRMLTATYGGVGQLDADVGDGRSEGAHGERHDVHGAPPHAALKEPPQRGLHLGRISPVVGRAGVLVARGTDEGPILDPGHVCGIGPGQIAVWALGVGEALECAGLDQLRRRDCRIRRRCRRTRGPGRAR